MRALLEKFHRFMRGNARSEGGKYEKRVHHDQLVPRNDFQDLYAKNKLKFKHWVEKWQEEDPSQSRHGRKKALMSTDPQKHVFEDVAIATFLQCLWQQEYQNNNPAECFEFIDLGCGNGFLVHLLSQLGYHGYGVDLAKRSIWDTFDSQTRLEQKTLHLPSLQFELPDSKDKDLWIIGNHPDELTAWIPVIAAKTSLTDTTSPQPRCKFIIIPCCFHDLCGRKNTDNMNRYTDPKLPGRYGSYVTYIEAIMTDTCGYTSEREWLRIPSTKNISLIGRRWNEDVLAFRSECGADSLTDEIQGTIHQLTDNIQFKPRKSAASSVSSQCPGGCSGHDTVTDDGPNPLAWSADMFPDLDQTLFD